MSGSSTSLTEDPVYRTVGIILAILSGVLIGVSFIFKKKGLINSRVEGEDNGHGYLKSAMWWSGMILMALGEIANFVAYALAPAVLVTPLGALSVVVSAVLSSIFLKEKLNFHGKLGCFISLLGVVVVVLNAPEQNAPDKIDDFMKLALAPGFLTYTVLIIVGSGLLVWKVEPKYGKTHPIVYISICSFIGSLSVCTLQALGGSVIRTFNGDNQFTHWFIYILIVFVIITILTQINFLNKALNQFVTAEVTPVYYVVFTTATIVSSAILYQGFKTTAVSLTTLIFAFLTICSGVVILQTSRMYEALINPEVPFNNPNEKTESDPQDIVINVDHPTRSTTNPTDPHHDRDPTHRQLSPGASPTNISREFSHHSSLNSNTSHTSVIHKITSALNFERNDHLKPRALFTDSHLEQTRPSPNLSPRMSCSISPRRNSQSQSMMSLTQSNPQIHQTFSHTNSPTRTVTPLHVITLPSSPNDTPPTTTLPDPQPGPPPGNLPSPLSSPK